MNGGRKKNKENKNTWLSCTLSQQMWVTHHQTLDTHWRLCCPLRSSLGRATGSTFSMRDPSRLWGTPTFQLSTSRWACSSSAAPSASRSLTSPKCRWVACAPTSSTCANLTSPPSTAPWATSPTTSVRAPRTKCRKPGKHLIGYSDVSKELNIRIMLNLFIFVAMLIVLYSPQEVFLLWTCIVLHVHHAVPGGELMFCFYSNRHTHSVEFTLNQLIVTNVNNCLFHSFTCSLVSPGTALACCALWPSSPSLWCLFTPACPGSQTTSITPLMSWQAFYREPWWLTA